MKIEIKDNFTRVTIPAHKRTIRTQIHGRFLVQFPKLVMEFYQGCDPIYLPIYLRVRSSRSFNSTIQLQIIKKLNKYNFISLGNTNPVCLGYSYRGEINKRKINIMINKFFNSKFIHYSFTILW